VLLVTTLLRLSSNVASARIVLLEGHTGPDAAGKVIEAFGHFLVGGNYTVGIILFIILVIINFVVITRVPTDRRSQRALHSGCHARQADGDRRRSQAGLIGEEEARTRRAIISQEADFFARWTVPANSCAATPSPAF